MPANAAPEAILVAAYARIGEGYLGHLRAEFALLPWEARSRTGVLARDHLGSGGLFFPQPVIDFADDELEEDEIF